jgi:hypothetical protein
MYRLLLSLLPATFRRRFGPDMEEDFAELMAAKTAEQPIASPISRVLHHASAATRRSPRFGST